MGLGFRVLGVLGFGDWGYMVFGVWGFRVLGFGVLGFGVPCSARSLLSLHVLGLRCCCAGVYLET